MATDGDHENHGSSVNANGDIEEGPGSVGEINEGISDVVGGRIDDDEGDGSAIFSTSDTAAPTQPAASTISKGGEGEDEGRDMNKFRHGSVRMPHMIEQFFYESLLAPEDEQSMTHSSSDHLTDHGGGNGLGGGGGGDGVATSNNSLGNVVFESTFDMTEERLRRLFSLFDSDKDGRVSYDELRRGLAYQTTQGDLMDEASFQNMLRYLDLDNSGDISFDEFSEGMRLIMLRSLLKTVNEKKKQMPSLKGSVVTEVLDYDPHRLQRHLVEGYDQIQQSIRLARSQQREQHALLLSESVQNMSLLDFFFDKRPDWVRCRWINITCTNEGRSTADQTLKMCALKYKLHPLAIEDALDCNYQKPKAESYSDHYFVMIPLFYLELEDGTDEQTNRTKSGIFGRFKAWWNGKKNSSTSFEDDSGKSRFRRDFDTEVEEDYFSDVGWDPTQKRIKKIGVQMTSVFVTMPLGETLISFNNSGSLSRCWDRTKNELKKSYSKLRQYDGQYLAYSLLDQAVDIIGPIIKSIRYAIRTEQQHLEKTQYQDLTYMHRLRENLKRMFNKLKPFIRLLEHIIEDETVSPGPTVFLRDVLDNLENYFEDIRHLISVCDAVDDEQEKFERRQMDSTLYTLTVISAVFLPAQFLTGVWGMNFENMPELDKKNGYAMFWVLAVALMITTLLLLNCGRKRV